MKKMIFAAIAMIIGFAAHAANPELIFATTTAGDQIVFGTGTIISVKKDPANMRTLVRYGSAIQYVADDAAWSKHAKFVAACGAHCMAVPGSTVGHYVNVVDSNGVYCQSASYTQVSYVSAPPESISGDGCTFYQAVKANAN